MFDANQKSASDEFYHQTKSELNPISPEKTEKPLAPRTKWKHKTLSKEILLRETSVCSWGFLGNQTHIRSPGPPNLPDASLSCSIKSRPVMSATELGSMFESSSRSGSLSTDTLHRFDFIWATSFFRCIRSTSGLSVVSPPLPDSLWVVIVTKWVGCEEEKKRYKFDLFFDWTRLSREIDDWFFVWLAVNFSASH